MNKLDEILTEWSKDSKIDQSEPAKELLNIPILHSKYLNILSKHRLLLKDNEIKTIKMKKIKYEYYSGKMSENTLKEYGWSQFPYILKSDISIYMDSDEDLCKLKINKALLEEIIEVCSSIMKELNSRTFQLKSAIDYEKFISGVN